jgi:hypothetical protein
VLNPEIVSVVDSDLRGDLPLEDLKHDQRCGPKNHQRFRANDFVADSGKNRIRSFPRFDFISRNGILVIRE